MPINAPRFASAGALAPKSKADMAFIMHSLSWLAANGTAAIVCFPGIMYRGGAEQRALSEFEKYRVTQDRLYQNDFDKVLLDESFVVDEVQQALDGEDKDE